MVRGLILRRKISKAAWDHGQNWVKCGNFAGDGKIKSILHAFRVSLADLVNHCGCEVFENQYRISGKGYFCRTFDERHPASLSGSTPSGPRRPSNRTQHFRGFCRY